MYIQSLRCRSPQKQAALFFFRGYHTSKCSCLLFLVKNEYEMEFKLKSLIVFLTKNKEKPADQMFCDERNLKFEVNLFLNQHICVFVVALICLQFWSLIFNVSLIIIWCGESEVNFAWTHHGVLPPRKMGGTSLSWWVDLLNWALNGGDSPYEGLTENQLSGGTPLLSLKKEEIILKK